MLANGNFSFGSGHDRMENNMPNTYNIYKIKHHKVKELKDKLKSVGLVEQKTLPTLNYSKTFYFSENIKGNDVWWWKTYREFFNDDVKEPKNTLTLACYYAKT